MKPRRNLYGIHNDFSAVAGGLRRGCILIRNRVRDGGLAFYVRDLRITSTFVVASIWCSISPIRSSSFLTSRLVRSYSLRRTGDLSRAWLADAMGTYAFDAYSGCVEGTNTGTGKS